MNWLDIASIVFVCVTANHLGLISAIQNVTKCNRLPIISCPKCLVFWSVLAYGIAESNFLCLTLHSLLTLLAISFLASYSALWLELLEGFIDTLYMKLYGKIYETSDNTTASDTDGGDSTGTVPEL